MFLMNKAPAAGLAHTARLPPGAPCISATRCRPICLARKAKAVDPLVQRFKQEYDSEILEVIDMRYNYNMQEYMEYLKELVDRVQEIAEQGKSLPASDTGILLRALEPRSGCVLEFLDLHETVAPWHNSVPTYKDLRTLDRGLALKQVFEGEAEEGEAKVGGATLNQLAVLLGLQLRDLARSLQVTKRGGAKEVPTKMLLLPLLLETYVLDIPHMTQHAKQPAPQVLVDALAECSARRDELQAQLEGNKPDEATQIDLKKLRKSQSAAVISLGEALQQGVDEYNTCVDAMLDVHGETGLASFLNMLGAAWYKELFWLPSCWEALMEFWAPRMQIKDLEMLALRVCDASRSPVLTEEEHKDLVACAERVLHLMKQRVDEQLSSKKPAAPAPAGKPAQPEYAHMLNACKALLRQLVYAKGLGDEDDMDRVEEHPLNKQVAEAVAAAAKLAKAEGSTTALNKSLQEEVGNYGTLAALCKMEGVPI